MERQQIRSLYEDAAKKIRAEDPEAILFVEPQVFTAFGFTDTLLFNPGFGNLAYAPHDYDIIALGAGLSTNGGLAVDLTLDMERMQADKWGAPLFIGEYGVEGSGGLFLDSLLRNYYKHMDQSFVSAAQWDYSPSWTSQNSDGWDRENMSVVDSQGNIRGNLIVRPYAASVAGEPVEMKTDLSSPLSRTLDFSWVNDPSLGETEFALPAELQVSVARSSFASNNPDLACSFDSDGTVLRCYGSRSGLHQIHLQLQASSR
jgi:hypothetical protein